MSRRDPTRTPFWTEREDGFHFPILPIRGPSLVSPIAARIGAGMIYAARSAKVIVWMLTYWDSPISSEDIAQIRVKVSTDVLWPLKSETNPKAASGRRVPKISSQNTIVSAL